MEVEQAVRKRDLLEFQLMAQELQELRFSYDNFKKEAQKKEDEFAVFLLEVYNALGRASRTAGEDREGMLLLMNKIEDFLSKKGYLVFPKAGDSFDENTMEVVTLRGTGRRVLEVVSYGLKRAGKVTERKGTTEILVLKQARVVVG